MFTRKDLVRLLWPLVVEQILAVTIGMADTVMVAGEGEAAVSGIALVDSINVLLINIFSALATGGAIVASQYIGRDDMDNASVAAKQLLYVVAILSSLIMVLCLLFGSGLLDLLFGDVEAAVMDNSRVYFVLSAVSYPFLGIYNVGAALFRAMNNSRVSMFTSVLMNAVNIGGNALLIFVFQMGVAGAGTATLVSRALGAVIMVILIVRPSHRIYIRRLWKPEFHWKMVQNILKIGVPNGLENGMFQVGKILVQGLVAGFGTAAITANAIANTVVSVPLLPGSAIGLGLITVVGQCIGAGRYDEARRYMLRLTGIAAAGISVLNLLLFFVLDPVIQLYHPSEVTYGLAWEIIVAHSIVSSLLWALAFVLPNGLRAANDVRFTMITSILSMWIFRIGFSYLLAVGLQMGLLGTWLAMFIDWVARVIAFMVRFLRGKWKEKRLID